MNKAPKPYFTTREVAKLLRVSPEKVLGWIHRGELRAVNVSNRIRPQYRVSRDDLDARSATEMDYRRD
jgi:excisionase family DNA binding protein